MNKNLLLTLGAVSCAVAAFYCRRISKQLENSKRDDNGTYKYIDGDGNEIEVGTYKVPSDKDRGFYF